MDILTGFRWGLDAIWAILSADPKFTLALGLFIISIVILSLTIEFIRYRKLKSSGILEVDKMPGKVFEEYLQTLLKHRGYQVDRTPSTGDYGADLVLATTGRKIIVQAKRYKKKVGLKAVQEIASAKNHYKADECWVITNNYFTAPAVKLAASNNVKLIDRTLLMKWMIEINKTA